MIAFGPVPSRRLGHSLGINNIFHKHCTYDCIYCQVGATTDHSLERRPFYAPEQIAGEVEQLLSDARQSGDRVDYLSFVPDGEPTLDINLGRSIELLRPLGVPIAVFTNSSLLELPQVREELALADLVSIKVDAAHPTIWRKTNRPNKQIYFAAMQDGMRSFARTYNGRLITETMLVSGINDESTHLEKVAAFVRELKPEVAYLGIPTRPPLFDWVKAPGEEVLNEAFQIFSRQLPTVEYLLGFPEADFGASVDPVENLLSTTAVHPMRESEVQEFLRRSDATHELVDRLIREKKIKKVSHSGQTFYVRRYAFEEQ